MVPDQDSITLFGVLEGAGFQSGVVVEASTNDNPGVIVDSTVSDANGDYSLTLPTDNGPFHGVISFQLEGHKPHTWHRPSGLYEDYELSTGILNQVNYENFLGTFGYRELNDRPTIGIGLFDCGDDDFLRDAVITVTPADGDTHVGYTGPQGSLLDVESTRSGFSWVFGVVPGDVNVTITYQDVEIVNYDLATQPNSYHTISTLPVRGG